MHTPDVTQFAAVDLGSNSFHMVVAKVEDGQLRVIDKLRDQVQLGLGMGDDKMISEDAWQRGLECLANFGQRLRGIPRSNCRIVGTNTLRRAVNGEDFVREANQLLGHKIEIISGREEARLIYEGVLRDASEPNRSRLVIDIGGGSTELIVGDGFDPTVVESINVGCVSMSQRHFSKGRITSAAMRSTANNTLMELHPVLHKYKQAKWQEAVGCSGTIKTINEVTRQLGYSDGDGFSAEALDKLAAHMVKAGQNDKLGYEGLPDRRLAVLPGGVALLQALFKALNIEHMLVSETALREGVIYDLHGSKHHANVQQSTMSRLASKYDIDTEQAKRVQNTAESLWQQAKKSAAIEEIDLQQLQFAAPLFELGWIVAHSQYHKHGHYLLANSDMRGFSNTEQQLLAKLVRYHRRKLPTPLEQSFSPAQQQTLLLLRLAVIIHRDRINRPAPPLQLHFNDDSVAMIADSDWLESNPLTAAELKAESHEWKRVGMRVELNPDS